MNVMSFISEHKKLVGIGVASIVAIVAGVIFLKKEDEYAETFVGEGDRDIYPDENEVVETKEAEVISED